MTEKKEEAKPEEKKPEEPKAEAPKPKGPPPKKILVIDDEEPVRRMLSKILETCGYKVVTAEDGRSGVVRAFTERPDLILIDLAMPGMEGRQAIAGIKADLSTEAIPVIVLTAESTKENILEAKALGARSVVAKIGFQLESFLDRIKDALAPVAPARR
ncbi:MAG TPA: response regulator [Planctomycetota bacterium]|nr:response regulator [Planctomycetota bacterium]